MVSTDSSQLVGLLPVEVRRMRPEEIPEALSLIHTSIRELTAEDYTPEQIKKIVSSYHRSVLSNGTVIVAEYQAKIVGVAKTSRLLTIKTIEAVFTHPEFVGKGIGRAMVSELEESARRLRAKELVVYSSMTAVGFYEALEFERGGESKILGDVQVVRMHRQLMADSWSSWISAIWSLVLTLAGTCGLVYVFRLLMELLLF